MMAPSHKRRASDHIASSPKRRRTAGGSENSRSEGQDFDVFEGPTSSPKSNSGSENILFPELEKGVWPVKRLLEKRRRGRGVQYLVEWADHPHTQEKFPTEWVSRVLCSEAFRFVASC